MLNPLIVEAFVTDLKMGKRGERLRDKNEIGGKRESKHKHMLSKIDSEIDFGHGQPKPRKDLASRNFEEPWVGSKLGKTFKE